MATATTKTIYGFDKSEAERRQFWLLERTGSPRAVWGPYTLLDAIQAKGSRHLIIYGTGLSDGLSLPEGHVTRMLEAGTIWVCRQASDA